MKTNDREVIPLFLARNSKLSIVNKDVAEKFKIDTNFLYQIHLITFLADNLVNCLLILANNNGMVSDTLGVFEISEKDKCKDFCNCVFRLFGKNEYDFVEYDGRPISENEYLANAALWIKGQIY